jgi:LuxR family maltose regulon positive regulatory protein
LWTKLAIPRTPPTFVRRPRLESRLMVGAALPITLVTAGPGAGKTLAVAAWAASGRALGPVAWLTVDDTDNDQVLFWSDLLAAFTSSGAIPPGNPIHELAPTAPFNPALIDLVRVGLAELDEPIVLVLDDLHEVVDQAVLDGLDRLLTHAPPALRVVIVTRADPPLRLHRLRVRGELAEVRTDDLAFNPAETDQMFAQHGLVLSEPQRAALLARTEGWAAGLRLAAMSLDADHVDNGIAAFSGDERTVAEYLAEEVLERQPPEVRTFLLQTSIADRLSGSLADALTGRSDGRRVL